MEATATLAAGVAHDFNNLMTGVMANGYLLRQDFADDPETQSIVSTIIECAARGGRLAQQLLAFARGGKYTPTVADLNAIIRESERLEAHAVGDGIELHLDLAEDLHAIEADPVQISQVVSNLLRNAIEAMRAGGRVTISTDNVVLDGNRPAPLADLSDGPYVILTVSDTGTGMSADTVARVFEPFFTTKEGGRGMGLAATYGIVTHHGGKIDVRSQPGSGTAFTVYLPALPAERRATRPAPAPAPARAGTRPSRGTVLFVDDEVAILSPTGRLLEAKGFRVLAAESGPEAIAIARAAATPIDIILLDMRMPGMSGAEAFDPLRAAQPGAQVFVCSGYELDSAARSLFERGAVGFIRKPFTIDELVRTIESPPRQSTGGAEP
jgi:CheY-like chemotaxis protein